MTPRPRLREERLQTILDLVQREGSVRTADLTRRFQVSEMTVHRDLEELAARGLIRRVRGGAVAVSRPDSLPTTCVTCHMDVPQHTRVVLHLKDGSQRHACCPHCALVYASQHSEQIAVILVRDLLRQYVVDARLAHYVVDTDLVVCCRPSVLAFKDGEDAVRFQRGFGGRLATFAEALAFVSAAHNSDHEEASP